ncbi:YhcN/YlaJ family sporulation lipoprotein [Paenibacillus anaericanus]|uniref:YhcN/YlaJ family sporulation lipoprotein n=1 Tax=Paenibacillus anaericanus TaxID=170367 RepID=A0A3S1EL74_9BACL|nr:YhcN/YlaJ family sporulation lipoprotein [Paenibacillus anaericanus]MDQ0088429.1 YhcN/YlaJ family sporulation lipoprotein [Paenibacillus anaericanus]RUT47952.1 YhcN/YlaJ family sporulation lipoprotein [Paenibacillus anaericanus]
MRIWLCLLLMASLLAGCGTMSKKASPSPQNQTENTPRVQSTNQNGTSKITGLSKNEQINRQTHLEELVKHVEGVKGAHCVVLGNTAVVAIDVEGNLERARVGSIKYTVAEALRKDPQGANAIVTADLDLSHRISEIGQKIKEGHPISGFATELADIMGRIVPQLPKDTKPRANTNQPANPINKLEQKTTTPKNDKTKEMKIAPDGKS